jgi:LemA protein
LVSQDENCNAKWAQVENAYQRRADLIPNIVETVKGEANFEQETLTKVMEARASATQVTIDPSKMTEEDMKRFEDAQNTFGGTISRLLSVAESYPTLQANQAFRDLRVELEGTENRISVERKNFIDAVQQYNTTRRRFPTNITASLFGFGKRATFTAQPGSENVPKVDFSTK